ncbi:MAG: hypothetical protein E6G94_00415 [Alphaproteobacteria bacterium]|nr:MAG: hypothetical protein E6G94_00415 [Alphaproteobacteria bacterium]
MDGGSGGMLVRSIDLEDADRSYFLKRAEAELEQAQTSSDPQAVRCHYELAGLYLDLVYNEEALSGWKLSRSSETAPSEDAAGKAHPGAILLDFAQILRRPLPVSLQLLPITRRP